MVTMKNKFLLSFVFVAMSAGVQANDLSPEMRSILQRGFDESRCQEQDFDCCGSTRLNVDSLCARRIETKCEDACRINAKVACIKHLASEHICAKELDVECKAEIKELCAKDIKSECACIGNLGVNNICAQSARVSDFLQCGKYQATVVFDAPYTYTLGGNVNFNEILDDPNNDVSLNPTFYTAPISGQYIATVQVDQGDLVTANPVIGIPVAQVYIVINGTRARSTFTPYLSFHSKQQSTVTALIHLNAGDVVSSEYEVGVMDDAVGFLDLTGTVVIAGNGTETVAGNSVFKIALLTADCNGSPICAPCDPCCAPDEDCCFEICQPCCEPKAAAPKASAPKAKKTMLEE